MAQPTPAPPSGPVEFPITTTNGSFNGQEYVDVTFWASNFPKDYGFSISLDVAEGYEILSVNGNFLSVTDDNYKLELEGQRLNLLTSTPLPTFQPGTINTALFTLRIEEKNKARAAAGTGSEPKLSDILSLNTKGAIKPFCTATATGQGQALTLQFIEPAATDGHKAEQLQAWPNPFVEQLNFSFEAPAAQLAEVVLNDAQGRQLARSQPQLTLPAKTSPTSGS
ncbi:MAG: hypothetical protein HC821_00320 [Lewinella sp.]|nr:hypothetical protein [Lewinella sp.]